MEAPVRGVVVVVVPVQPASHDQENYGIRSGRWRDLRVVELGKVSLVRPSLDR